MQKGALKSLMCEIQNKFILSNFLYTVFTLNI